MTVLEQLRKTIEDGTSGGDREAGEGGIEAAYSCRADCGRGHDSGYANSGENYKSNGADIIKILAAAEVCARVLNCWRNRTRSLAGGISEL